MITMPEPTQRQYEAFFKALRARNVQVVDISAVEYAGEVVRSAVDVGWLTLDVDNASPKEVMNLKRQIVNYLQEVLADPLASPAPSPTS